ncbi:hypothetical protein DIURU_003881 [Diutina rugosa]|uniref:Carboxypeptidase n=1 Tax=Diutina rugosa TaxID=5481 RepID=A0A642URB8_DIURU|nr:uncharacterized protein DIURU_003881 [Diutina rugosa]KAA8900300.1 hypothetical protein DIURU_003881 [Diutina rugosa]
MRVSHLSLVLAGASALTLPQQVLDAANQLQEGFNVGDHLDALKQNLGSLGAIGHHAIASVIDKLQVPKEQAQLWAEMMLEFPDAVAQLDFKAPAKKLSGFKPDWQFVVTDAKHPNYQLRGKSTPESLGIDKVKQYSGYIDDLEEDKHFFYWFFESRGDPKKDPTILWLNGGPGCSSLTGLFFELGPASIGPALKPIPNDYSWNNNANVIFLDQPINVGYSYSSQSVSDTVAAGKDVYSFLSLFFKQFPQYAKNDFHIAGESYAGHYIPVFATEILSHDDRNFNLTSVLIGNGLTDPLTQYEYYQPMACGEGGADPVLDQEQCDSMAKSIPRCLSLIQSCYDSESVWSCVPATIYCNNAQMGPYQKTGKNVYDIRKNCEGSSLCYEDLDYIDKYLNQKEVMEALGVEVDSYQGCNFDINKNFLFAGDWMKPYHRAVTDLLERGLPVLIYAGDKDFICNWLGNQAWTNVLPWKHSDAFASAEEKPFEIKGKLRTLGGAVFDSPLASTKAGTVKNYEHFTFLRLFDGGHMVPYDQPESSLEMLSRWIKGNYKLEKKLLQ